MGIAIVSWRAFVGMLSSRTPPRVEPKTVNVTVKGRMRCSTTPFCANGSDPPALMKMRAIMFVAMATCGYNSECDKDRNGNEGCAASDHANAASQEKNGGD